MVGGGMRLHKLKIGFDTAVTGFDRVRFDKARIKGCCDPWV